MSTARDVLVAALQVVVPKGIQVEKYTRELDGPDKPVLMVRVDEVRRHPSAPLAKRRYGFALILVSPATDPGKADDDLDDALEPVLRAIETTPTLPQWEVARRGVYGTAVKRLAYEITLPVDMNITEE